VLKIDHVRVGAWSTLGNCPVPLYGADIGDYAYVAPHSVIMKREHLQPGLRYEGAPTRQQCDQTQSALRPVVTRAASRSGRHRAVRQGAAAVPPPRPRPSADR
jgi:carbonic anhydrase/acetyltransferase-like protein (isoleucine patch superfamily)